MPFDLQTCARPNILALQPYRCARDDYKDDGTNILLDANENAYGPGLAHSEDGKLMDGTAVRIDYIDLNGLNRYPDPHQKQLKELLCYYRNYGQNHPSLETDNVFLGVGSDEAIDALIRAFCMPGKDKLLTCPPTYGMYAVSAQVNDVEVVQVPLDVDNGFKLQPDKINAKLAEDPSIKLVYICSPGNPTGNLVAPEDVESILRHPTWNGVVVLDEAYIDFAPAGSSLADWVGIYPNLVVMQTLSKAFGLAGIRLGIAFTSTEIAKLLNSLKAPYNISNPTSQLAIKALQSRHLEVMLRNIELIKTQRTRLLGELPWIKGVGKILGGQDANFLLVQMLDPSGNPSNECALQVYEQLAERKGVVVRFRGKELGCKGCLRITVGTEWEVTKFLKELKRILQDIHMEWFIMPDEDPEEKREKYANGVVS
jgi:histidinol-phosphate aminotransferase